MSYRATAAPSRPAPPVPHRGSDSPGGLVPPRSGLPGAGSRVPVSAVSQSRGCPSPGCCRAWKVKGFGIAHSDPAACAARGIRARTAQGGTRGGCAGRAPQRRGEPGWPLPAGLSGHYSSGTEPGVTRGPGCPGAGASRRGWAVPPCHPGVSRGGAGPAGGGAATAPAAPGGLTWPGRGADMADGSRQSRLAAAKKKVRGRGSGQDGTRRDGAGGGCVPRAPRWPDPGPGRARPPPRGAGRAAAAAPSLRAREPAGVRGCGPAFSAGGRGEAGPGWLRCCEGCLGWCAAVVSSPPSFLLPPPPSFFSLFFPRIFSLGAARLPASRRDALLCQSHRNGKVSWSSSGFHFEILPIMGSSFVLLHPPLPHRARAGGAVI